MAERVTITVERGAPMTALEQRIARVVVRSQHPELDDAKIDVLIGFEAGAATARAIIAELELDDRCGSTYAGRRCVRQAGHGDNHSEHVTPQRGSLVWADTLVPDR